MSAELWIAYLLAVTIVLIIPGPTIILAVSQAVTCGRRSVVPLAAGVALGDFTAMTLSLLGLGAVMRASAALFTVFIFKWIGALYLIYLGIRLWRADPKRECFGSPLCISSVGLFKSAFIVTALNPRVLPFLWHFCRSSSARANRWRVNSSCWAAPFWYWAPSTPRFTPCLPAG